MFKFFKFVYKALVMSTIELKNEFHNLIDKIWDKELLEKFYYLMDSANESSITWESLPESERAEILLSDEESRLDENLISHEEMKKKYSKWL